MTETTLPRDENYNPRAMIRVEIRFESEFPIKTEWYECDISEINRDFKPIIDELTPHFRDEISSTMSSDEEEIDEILYGAMIDFDLFLANEVFWEIYDDLIKNGEATYQDDEAHLPTLTNSFGITVEAKLLNPNKKEINKNS